MRLLVAAIGLTGGALLTYVGLFLVGYSGDTGRDDDVHIKVGDSRVDADLVGVPLAAAGFIAIAASVLTLRRRAR